MKSKVLIVGQMPPPYGGQAIMIKELVECFIDEPNVSNIRMVFSKDLSSTGKFTFNKVFELFSVVLKIWVYKVFNNPSTLYYPPAGAGNKLPFYRDAFILITTRFLFTKTIFHFHASGLSELFRKLNFIERGIFKLAFNFPDISIVMSKRGQVDSIFVKSKIIKIIPNGIPSTTFFTKKVVDREKVPIILFVGLVCKSKGVDVLLEACLWLKNKNIEFKLNIVGKFESQSYEKYLVEYIRINNLQNCIFFKGVLIGELKNQIFLESDIFCFPTFFEHENFPIVILEAMMYGLAVVTTDWRSIPEIIDNNVTGIVCPIKSYDKIAEALLLLIQNSDIRSELGEKAQYEFKKKYTRDVFYKNMRSLFNNL